jgi:uridine kinase
MQSINYPCIIGISGNSGSGKSTLSERLQQELNSTQVAWDDFDDISTGPEDYVDWFKREGHYDEWNYPELAKVLDGLKSGSDLKHPVTGEILYSSKYIIFDAPLGRLHKQTGLYIDFWIHLSVPLDVSLCRRILRDFSSDIKTKTDLLDEISFICIQQDHYFLMMFIKLKLI